MSKPQNKFTRELDRLMSTNGGKFMQAKALDALGQRLHIDRMHFEDNDAYLKRISQDPRFQKQRDDLLKMAAEEGVVTTSIRLEVESSLSATLLDEISKL